MTTLAASTAAVDPDIIQLPPVRLEGNTLLELLQKRRSARAYSDRPVDDQLLSDLLWAAFGVSNRDGYRTAPSARNWREIDIYVTRTDGAFRYDPHQRQLVRICRDDLRSMTGLQDYVADAPIDLVYVANLDRMGGAVEGEKLFFAPADAAAIAQNVYLFCASSGLATIVRGLIDRDGLAARMKLRPSQRIIFAQCVGYPGP